MRPGVVLSDEPDAVVGVVRRRRVVERQERAGQQLDAEQREQHAAEREEPAGAGGQRLVEQDCTRARNPVR